MWAVSWAVFFYLNKRGIDYIKKFQFTILYFIFISVFLLSAFWKEYIPYINIDLKPLPFILLFLLFTIGIFLYSFVRNNFNPPVKLIEKNPKLFFLRLDDRYFASKSFEILFQQLLIILLIIWLDQSGFSIVFIIIFFALLFGFVGHVHLIHSRGKSFGLIFVASSMLSSVIFPVLIIYLPWGFVYSYIVHWFFYIILGLFFWRKTA